MNPRSSDPEPQRVTAYARLAGMPPVFDLDEFARTLGMPRNQAVKYAHRWCKAGYLEPLGGKVGTWFNLVADRKGPETRLAEAVSLLMRRPALVVGGKALLAHGWTTQRHVLTSLAVPITREVRTLPRLDHGLELLPRSLRWFRRIAEGAEPGVGGFLVARPEIALADALLAEARETGRTSGHAMSWNPVPDEICFDDDDEDAAATLRALTRIGATQEEVDAIADRMRWEHPEPEATAAPGGC